LCMGAGMALLTLSPLDPAAEAMMSNYIPVIHSPVFFLGLSLIFCSVAFMLVKAFTSSPNDMFSRSLRLALQSAAFITLISLCAFIWSYTQMPSVIEGTQYYEIVFWGGGHVLQFTHTQILLVCWWLMMAALVKKFNVRPWLFYVLIGAGLLAALASPLGYRHEVTSSEHRNFFTQLMIGINGHAGALFLLLCMVPFWKARTERKGPNRALWSSLLMSGILYLYGGVLGLMIQGQNVVIPAHYHGSIVGITLAFMGLAYLLFPQLGYKHVAGWKLAYWQPIVYGVGQLMHISGLAYSGGYGVLRKTPGGMDDLAPTVKAALGFMGLGGLIAIIGGLMFVIVAWKALYTRHCEER
ncbi:MAG: cytochrome C oxidase subunit I, partial [Alphaproteobacteria bacterium]